MSEGQKINLAPYCRPFGVLTLAIVIAHFWFTTIDYNGVYANIDLKHYREMASVAPEILTSAQAPFVYRILPPWIAGVFGRGLESELLGFQVVAAWAVLFGAMMLYMYLGAKGVRDATALTMACLAVISQHVLGGVVFNPFQACDAISIALMLVMLLCIERGHIAGFIVASVLGAATREPCLLMLPVAIAYLLTQRTYMLEQGKRTLVRWIAACIPAALVFVIIRTAIHPVNAEWGIGAMVVENAYKFTDPESWVRLVLFAAAPISLIPLVFIRQTRTVLAANVHLVVLLVLVVASSFLGADTERLVAPAMVVYYLISARVMDERSSLVVNGVLIVAALVCSLHPIYARLSPFSASEAGSFGTVAFYLTSAVMLVVALVAVSIKTRFRTVHR